MLRPMTPTDPHVDPQALARATAAASLPNEPLFAHFGLTLADIGPGRARFEMTVRADMLNAGGVCHGGMIFMLADSALGFACNSRNQRALAAACAIEFVTPARVGDRLAATATEAHRGGRTAYYDVRVELPDGTLVALFRGRSAVTTGAVIPAAAS
jgi:acyl-CoA thioesterase